MTSTTTNSNLSSRVNRASPGIALIVVLGILALLLIIGVGFSITMRIERVAAKSYADSARGRQLMYAACARVMNDLNVYLADTNFGVLVYPDFSPPEQFIWASASTNGPVSDMLSVEAQSFIPLPLRSSLTKVTPKWINLTAPTNQVMGRYGYIVVDCSGLIDISESGGTNRSNGKSGRELKIDDMAPEFNGNASTFINNRSTKWVRFESIPEIWTLGSGSGISAEPRNLFPFSRFVPDGFWNGSSNTVRLNIGGTSADLSSQKTAIVNALTRANVESPSEVFDNLLDYVDPDITPQNYLSFCTEPVPMINEIVISNTLSRQVISAGTTQYTHDVYVYVETWHPFNTTINDVELAPTPPPFVFTTAPADLNPVATDFVGASPTKFNHTPFSYRTTTFHWQKKSQNSVFGAGGDSMIVRATLNNNLEVRKGGDVLDRVPALAGLAPASLQSRINGLKVFASNPMRADSLSGISVDDPRLNYLVGNGAGWWQDAPSTLGSTNNRAIAAAALGEGISTMHVRNRPLGEAPEGSVAELGFLSYGKPWRTIALYDTPAANMNPILDYFTMEVPKSKAGLVNVNTPYGEVLATAFNGAPVEQYPGATNASKHTRAQSKVYATNLIAVSQNTPVTNISQIGKFNRNFFASTLSLGANVNDAEIESIIRNSYELLGVRQNIFTAIIAIQILSPDGLPLIEQRAVAMIWRDPIPNQKGHHASFVRFFKPLTE